MKKTSLLIKQLNEYADRLEEPNMPINTEEIVSLMRDSAERLHELDERIDIMTADRN